MKASVSSETTSPSATRTVSCALGDRRAERQSGGDEAGREASAKS